MFDYAELRQQLNDHDSGHLKFARDAESLLRSWVNIDSTTPDTDAINQMQTGVAGELTKLGFKVERTANPDTSKTSGDLVVAELAGKASRFITLVSHVDTVLGLKETGPFTLSPDQLIAKGSGVIDNKGGLVVLIKGVESFLKTTPIPETFSIRVVISPNEEAGSIGFHPAFRRFAEDSFLVLGFEPALENGAIVESRRGNRWYLINTVGQEAHAGRCEGEELNAAHDISIKIARLHKLNRRARGENVNVGQISGGRDRFNVVCGHVTTKLDVRFASFKSRDTLHRKIEKILLKPAVSSKVTGRKTETTFTIVDDCPPFSTTPATKKFLKLYLKTVSRIERRKIQAKKAGGAGDVNYMSRENTVVLDGLGPIGGKMHTVDEYIHLPSLTSRALALADFLSLISKQ